MDEHNCEYATNPLRIKADWIHNLLQELEVSGVALPCGDYTDAYDAIETVRDTSAELLAACKEMLASDGLIGNQPSVWQAVQHTRAAIYKAEGRGE
jgi:hypothetical protein